MALLRYAHCLEKKKTEKNTPFKAVVSGFVEVCTLPRNTREKKRKQHTVKV